MISGVSDVVPRVVLLGASNLVLGWRSLMKAVFDHWHEPLHIMTAHGIGRSYLASSQFCWRTAPGILECNLWSELAESGRTSPSAALITDLGNDLVYGRTAAEVLQAASDAAGRLLDVNPACRIVVTRPPFESVKSLSQLRYLFFRSVLFPRCSLSLLEIIDQTYELDEGIRQLDGVTVVSQPSEWFGLDPIHIRRRFREFAFAAFLESWPKETAGLTCFERVPRRRPRMATCRVWGRERLCEQPSVSSERGSVSAW